MTRTSLALAAALLAACHAADQPVPPPVPSTAEAAEAARYHPVQLHLHGSLSEGDGTMDGHNAVAARLGTVDVLWWSDHDWRIAGHGRVDGTGFEEPRERQVVPYRDMPWTRDLDEAAVWWLEDKDPGLAESWARLSRDVVAQGRQALDLGARSTDGDGEWRFSGIVLESSGGRLRTPLAADVEVELLIHPATEPNRNRDLVVFLVLSRQVDGVVGLEYVLGGGGRPRVVERQGRRVGVVPVRIEVGEWNRLLLQPTHDAVALDLGGWDNSLREVRVGVAVRDGARARLYLDELRVRRHRTGAEVLARAEEIAAALERRYHRPNHVGLEVSYGVHMNVFLPQIEMPDLERYPHGIPPDEVVAWAHARGGVASYNHVFGTIDGHLDDYEERARYMLDNRAFGADLLEVGYPHRVLPLERHLAIWDALSRRGVRIVGIGTSDSHSQTAGWRDGNNHVTWVWSEGESREALIAGLRRGRAFFGNPMLFSGTLDLETADGVAMGSVVETAEPEHEVVLRLKGLPAGTEVRIVEDGAVVRTFTPAAGDFMTRWEVNTTHNRFVRAEVWQGEHGVVFSNCLYFVRKL